MKLKFLFLSFSLFIFSFSFSQGWFPVANGLPNGQIFSLLTYDSILYAGGAISEAVWAGDPGNGIAQWNGSSWSPLGKGVNNLVHAIIIYDGKVYVGGQFDSAGGIPANGIAIWDGHNWSTVGTGFNSLGLNSFAIFNGQLYAGGYFSTAGGKPIKNIARWNGSAWDSVGKGINQSGSEVDAMQEYKGKLYIAGIFDTAGGLHAEDLATWDGKKWDTVNRWDSASLMPSNTYGLIRTFLAYDSVLYMGGTLESLNWVCQWNDTNFKTPHFGTDYPVNAFVEKNGKVYAGGQFDSAGHVSANEIAVWNGSNWSTLGSGMSGTVSSAVNSLAFYNGNLYAAGYFNRAGGYNNINNIAVWGDSTLAVQPIFSNQSSIKVYPNPSSGIFTLSLSNVTEKYSIEIYNVLGEKVNFGTLKQVQGDYLIDINNQHDGVYFYRVITVDGSILGSGKFIIE